MTATTAPGAPLALPAAGRERGRNHLNLGVLMVALPSLMYFAALIGAYIHVKAFSDRWPPRGATIENYLGNTMVITMLLSAVTIEWAYSSVRRNLRTQASVAFGITIGLGLAFLNLLSYTAGRLRYTPASHPYGTIVAALGLPLGILVGLAVAFATLTLFRVAAGQVSAALPEQARATAWFWQFAVVATLAVWYTVVVMK